MANAINLVKQTQVVAGLQVARAAAVDPSPYFVARQEIEDPASGPGKALVCTEIGPPPPPADACELLVTPPATHNPPPPPKLVAV